MCLDEGKNSSLSGVGVLDLDEGGLCGGGKDCRLLDDEADKLSDASRALPISKLFELKVSLVDFLSILTLHSFILPSTFFNSLERTVAALWPCLSRT